MSTFDALPGRESLSGIAWYAIVATNATDLSDSLEVTIPAFDRNLRFGPCRWQSRDAVTLPARGDEALVIFDDRKQPWIIAWWPFT